MSMQNHAVSAARGVEWGGSTLSEAPVKSMQDFSGFTFLSYTLETAGPLPGFHCSENS